MCGDGAGVSPCVPLCCVADNINVRESHALSSSVLRVIPRGEAAVCDLAAALVEVYDERVSHAALRVPFVGASGPGWTTLCIRLHGVDTFWGAFG